MIEPRAARAKIIADLAGKPLDVLVIGGGIVGAGIARDAAMRGLSTGLVDQHDFAFGTSSRSSRLLHGGIRYLAQGKVRLVREASLEKTILHRIAPHLAEPLAFVFPSYKGTSWPLWQLRIGVKIYDFLCSGRNLGKSRALGRAEIFERAPGLTEKGLAGAVRYYDGFTQDARLVLDTLRSAGRHGAALANYTRFLSAEARGDEFLCRMSDELAGQKFELRARTVVNATGPWAEQLGFSKVQLRLTKGIHLVLQRDRLPVKDAVVITEGKRILFVIPWGERVIVGTTDTDYTGPVERVRTEAKDVEYVLRNANQFFPGAGLSTSDIITTWAGLRPLIADPHGRPSDISRSHRIDQPQPGWWDVAGGKLTTYRLMAEQTVDQVVRHLGTSAQRCATAEEPLLMEEQVRGISQTTPPAARRELVEHFCRGEWAVNLDDVMMRRSGWHYYHPEALQLANQVATWMGEVLGWSEEERLNQLERYRLASDWPLADGTQERDKSKVYA